MNDTEVTDYIDRIQQLVTFESEQEFLKISAMDSKNRHFTIFTLEEDKFIGTVSLDLLGINERALKCYRKCGSKIQDEIGMRFS